VEKRAIEVDDEVRSGSDEEKIEAEVFTSY